jgi:hypothetical protein
MSRKSRIIPFRWMPGSWGLRGETYLKAEAEYYYDGETLDRELAQIDFDSSNDRIAYDIARVEIDHRYQHIDDYTRDYRIATINYPTIEDGLTQAVAAVNLKHDHISFYEYEIILAGIELADDPHALAVRKAELDLIHAQVPQKDGEKALATLKGEPWVGLVDDYYDTEDGINGFCFEFDWNEEWILLLQQHGYVGVTDDDIMQQWFSDVCRNEAAETIPEIIPFNSRHVIRRPESGKKTD